MGVALPPLVAVARSAGFRAARDGHRMAATEVPGALDKVESIGERGRLCRGRCSPVGPENPVWLDVIEVGGRPVRSGYGLAVHRSTGPLAVSGVSAFAPEWGDLWFHIQGPVHDWKDAVEPSGHRRKLQTSQHGRGFIKGTAEAGDGTTLVLLQQHESRRDRFPPHSDPTDVHAARQRPPHAIGAVPLKGVRAGGPRSDRKLTHDAPGHIQHDHPHRTRECECEHDRTPWSDGIGVHLHRGQGETSTGRHPVFLLLDRIHRQPL